MRCSVAEPVVLQPSFFITDKASSPKMQPRLNDHVFQEDYSPVRSSSLIENEAIVDAPMWEGEGEGKRIKSTSVSYLFGYATGLVDEDIHLCARWIEDETSLIGAAVATDSGEPHFIHSIWWGPEIRRRIDNVKRRRVLREESENINARSDNNNDNDNDNANVNSVSDMAEIVVVDLASSPIIQWSIRHHDETHQQSVPFS
jgi:hypothetical protein